MRRKQFRNIHLTALLCLAAWQVMAISDRFRIVWYDDPSTTAVIAWNQTSGENPMLYLDINDHGSNAFEYTIVRKADRVVNAKGMSNHFVRLRGLQPNTTYYFLIKDSEGVSKRMFFTTAPNTRNERLSIIAGGDSRNFRDACQDANYLVSKLRPHCVMFGGDFTVDDADQQWRNWFEDWQLTISKDGRMTPIIVTRGNHEESNQTLIDLFDLPDKYAYYALTLGGDLLRIYTLNTMMPAGGQQREWLEKDLSTNTNVTWKVAQYHHPMRPHTKKKPEKNDQVVYWATLFLKFGMNLAVECDAHVVKSTWPIRPEPGSGSDAGFVRDDVTGTVYIGEGCWGAPLRENNDDKSWTRASESFNQFHWIFVDEDKIEVRFVKTDGADRVAEVNPTNIFLAPRGLVIWSPPSGDVITIPRLKGPTPYFGEELLAARSGNEGQASGHKGPVLQPAKAEEDETANWESCPQLLADVNSGDVMVKYAVVNQCDVEIRLIDIRLKEVIRLEIPRQRQGEYLKAVEMRKVPPGHYLAIVKDKNNQRLLRRFRVLKR
ncbi:MAG: metallophosphoesterase family protein [Saprospiraceae bacterium]|nr:MAG: metallophosphoesterase family protein [Saprospiraceae bacterium]